MVLNVHLNGIKKNMIKNNNFLFLFSIVFFYYLFPFISFQFSAIEAHYNFTIFFFTNYNLLFSILFIFIFCFVFIKLINITNIKVRRQDNSYNKIFYSILKTILVICIIFILLDILKLLIFWYNNYTNFNIDTRSLLYENFLNKRLTYIKIAIIISVFLFKTDKALSSLGFLSIIVLDLITFSRFK